MLGNPQTNIPHFDIGGPIMIPFMRAPYRCVLDVTRSPDWEVQIHCADRRIRISIQDSTSGANWGILQDRGIFLGPNAIFNDVDVERANAHVAWVGGRHRPLWKRMETP